VGSAHAGRGTRLAGVFIDLDGFKQVNDMYGHDAGDRFLVEVARRLRANLRAWTWLARLGGDEFSWAGGCARRGCRRNIVRKLLARRCGPTTSPAACRRASPRASA